MDTSLGVLSSVFAHRTRDPLYAIHPAISLDKATDRAGVLLAFICLDGVQGVSLPSEKAVDLPLTMACRLDSGHEHPICIRVVDSPLAWTGRVWPARVMFTSYGWLEPLRILITLIHHGLTGSPFQAYRRDLSQVGYSTDEYAQTNWKVN